MHNVFVLGNVGPGLLCFTIYTMFLFQAISSPGLLCFTVYTMFLFQAMQSPGFLWFIRLAVSFVVYKLSEVEIGLFWWMSVEERFCIAMHGLLRFGLFWVQKVFSLSIKMSLIKPFDTGSCISDVMNWFCTLFHHVPYVFVIVHALAFAVMCYTCVQCGKNLEQPGKLETNQTWAKLFSFWLDQPYEVCVMVFKRVMLHLQLIYIIICTISLIEVGFATHIASSLYGLISLIERWYK